ncbi:Chemotaxis regulator - transmits chemoreceptor signals to flagellar motor components CheY [hydrothermal vent metagenome]|uniref:Chemotaxis regulator - transmits chemoreceptor signals to flagellar motor components CheY n=1 Tax=hydrothermal vent metagenome TaxID=652676 RepID=A0A3B0ZK19_9ZZZZ
MILKPGQPNPYDLDLSGLKILIIDDFVEMRSMMRRTVESFRAKTLETAKDAEEALEKMAGRKFDLVLCDYNLGDGKDGQQILEEAKYRKYISSTTIWMMITAETTVEMVMGALEYKPDEYLTKPFAKQEFAVRTLKIQARKKELREIFLARDKQDYVKALDVTNEKLAHRETLELLQIKADLFERQNLWNEADAIYLKVLDVRSIAWAQLGHGRMLIKNHDFESAKDVLSKSIETMPALVEAYDLLASVYEKIDDNQNAQRILEEAIEQSPKAILRQKHLARIAYDNNNFDVAEKAYKRIIKIGKGSVHKTADDYVGLAKVYLAKKDSKNALRILANLKEDYKHNKQALLQGLVTESDVYSNTGEGAQASQALDAATALVKKTTVLSNTFTLDVIRIALNAKRSELADSLITMLVKNNHEETELHNQAKEYYVDAARSEDCEKLIQKAIEEMQKIVEAGVGLVNQGTFDAAIDHFQKSSKNTPNSIKINLALAQTLIKVMQKNRPSEKHLYLLRYSLERVAVLDAQNTLLPVLQEAYRHLGVSTQ